MRFRHAGGSYDMKVDLELGIQLDKLGNHVDNS